MSKLYYLFFDFFFNKYNVVIFGNGKYVVKKLR